MQNETTNAVEKATIHDEIARRAYELWEQEGCVIGTGIQNWLEAEQELRGTPAPNGNPAYPSRVERERIVAANVGNNEPVAKIPADALRSKP